MQKSLILYFFIVSIIYCIYTTYPLCVVELIKADIGPEAWYSRDRSPSYQGQHPRVPRENLHMRLLYYEEMYSCIHTYNSKKLIMF